MSTPVFPREPVKGKPMTEIEHIEDNSSIEKGDLPQRSENYGALVALAAEETSLSTLQSIQKYRVAFCWALFMSIGACMAGFDSSISSGVIGVVAFRNDQGSLINKQQVVSAAWQSGWSGAARIGQLIGGLGAGSLADRVGRKGAIFCGTIVSIGSIFLQFFLKPQTPVMLLFGRSINAVAMGVYACMASNYTAEVSPIGIRGVTTGGVNLFVVIGQFLATIVLDVTGTRTDSYSYRIPYAVQWFFPVLLLSGLYFVPESPWYLVRKGRIDDARASLKRLLRGSGSDPELHLRGIHETIELEALNPEKGSYLDLFRGRNLRRTGIASMVFIMQESAGVQFVLGYSTYFFELAGFVTADAFKLSVGTLALAMVGNFIGLATINSLGRRTLFFWGMIVCTIDCLLIGICSLIPGPHALWAMAAFTMLYMLCYQSGIGPVAYCLYAEISSAKMRSKTVGWGVMVNQVFAGIVQVINPYLINPNEANLGGRVGWIFGGCGVLGTIWAYFCIPETKGLSVDQIDELFERKISARKFHLTEFHGLENEIVH